MAETDKLKSIPLFRNFSGSMQDEFLASFKQSSYAAGDVIFKEKAAGDSLYIIASGEVIIEKGMDEEGLEFKTLAILAGGDFFGEMALIDQAPRFAQARASADSVLYEVARQPFFAFIKDHPETGIGVISEIMRTVFRRLQHTSSELTMLFDLSRLLLTQHKSPAAFLSAVMDQMKIYMQGAWNVKAYVYNVFNEEYEEVYTREDFPPAGEPAPLPARPDAGWQDDFSYTLLCAAEGRPLACAVFRRSEKLSGVEKNNLATIFNTISSIAGSAMLNIGHQTEAALMAKLRNQKNII